MSAVQRALAALYHDDAMIMWHALAAYVENGRDEPDVCPDLARAEALLAALDAAVAEPVAPRP